ncbi:TOM1-like protein 2 [Linum grandiflorum]
MDKLKLAEWGERLRTGGAQMSRVVSDKMKEILQAPTPESKMVDDATAETLAEPNWGLNLRICALINSEEFNFASEKALDEMVKLIDNPLSDPENRSRAMQLIAAWGESEDLEYLPVFRQTYMSLKQRSVLPEGNVAPVENSLESYFQPMPPPGSYPVPDSGLPGLGQGTFPQNYLSAEEKNEVLLKKPVNVPTSMQEDLTVSLYEKCQQSQPAVQQLIESTTDDEAMLFEALNLHDELQRVISQFKDLEAGLEQSVKSPESSEPAPAVITVSQDHGKLPDGEGAESSIGENRKSIIDMKAGN